MALTHANNTQKAPDPVKASAHIRVILALALSGLAELASLFFIQPLLPTLAVEYNVPVSQVSIILSAETALLAIGLLFTGTLSDHYGRKRVIIVSLLLGGILTLLCAGRILGDAGGAACGDWSGAERHRGGSNRLHQ